MTSVGFRSLVLATMLTWGCTQRPPPVQFAPRRTFSPSEVAALLPVRVLRLSNAELEESASALLDTDVALSAALPPDIRVDGYTRNTHSSVSPLWGSRWRQIATELGQEHVRNHRNALQCEEQARTKCARAFINDFGERAFYRPLSKNEIDQLFSVYETALDLEDDHPRALGWVVGALLISPSFIYVSEEGLSTGHEQVRYLSELEVASVLSYMLRGKPPDDELLRAARHGELLSPEARQNQARRLLSQSDTRYHFRRFVHEWLEVDGIESTSKDDSVTAHYEGLKSSMLAETSAFVDEVFVHRGASLASLLTAGFSSVDQKMARYYDLDAWGPRVPSRQVGRLGVLQHASFLSAHAHPDGTSPIKRGDFILRRILCVDIPRPEEIGIEVVIPAVTETTTTRERFSAHVSAPGCASCHNIIDPLGYAFEQFDAAGKHRKSENGKPLVTAGTFQHEGFSASFSGSDDLTLWLAQQPESARCFRSHALRFFTSGGHEEHLLAFQKLIEQAAANDDGSAASDNLLENLVAYAESDLFLYRRVVE